jgi:mitogen-activated protein kinase kinase kinase
MSVVKTISMVNIVYTDNTVIKKIPIEFHPRNEFSILSTLQESGIVQVHDYYEDDNFGYIEMEKSSFGSLELYSFSEQEIKFIGRQILLSLSAMHEKDIIHCDIKPHNILLFDNCNVKLCDFGISLSGSKMHNDIKGSPPYLAPEIITELSYSHASDIWAFGATILDIIRNVHPFDDMTDSIQIIYNLGSNPSCIKNYYPSSLSDSCISVLDSCFNPNPLHRPSAKQLLSFPFFM